MGTALYPHTHATSAARCRIQRSMSVDRYSNVFVSIRDDNDTGFYWLRDIVGAMLYDVM